MSESLTSSSCAKPPDSKEHAASAPRQSPARRHQRSAPEIKVRSVCQLLSGIRATSVSHEHGISQPLLCIWKHRAIKAIADEFECEHSIARNLFKESDHAHKIPLHRPRVSVGSKTRPKAEMAEIRDRIASLEGMFAELIEKLSPGTQVSHGLASLTSSDATCAPGDAIPLNGVRSVGVRTA